MQSNVDFQETLSKDAVIEYLTKDVTKVGSGLVSQGYGTQLLSAH
jgi:hypothetical protein